MIKAIIIDDEASARKSLELAITDFCPQVSIIGIADDSLKGLKMIQQKNPDLVFLDVEMPHMTGVELIQSFKQRNFEVIFTTAYEQYALNAIKHNAIDYLLKPINVIELINSVKKVEDKLTTKQTPTLQEENTLKEALSDKIAVSTVGGTEYLSIKEIIMVEADGSYTKIHSVGNKTKTTSKSLKEWENLLTDPIFFRIHKSYIVNLSYISKYIPTRDGGFLKLQEEKIAGVSRKLKSTIVELLSKYTR